MPTRDPEYLKRKYKRRHKRYMERLYANPVYVVRQMRRRLNGLSRRLYKFSPECAVRKVALPRRKLSPLERRVRQLAWERKLQKRAWKHKLNNLSRRLNKFSPEQIKRRMWRDDPARRLRAYVDKRKRELAEEALLMTLQEMGWLNERYEIIGSMP